MKKANITNLPAPTRIVIIGVIMLSGLLTILFRSYSEQVKGGDDYRDLVARQSIRRIRIPARRGRIISADDQILADNMFDYELVFYPEEMRFNRRKKTVDYMLKTAENMAAAIGRKSELTAEEINQHLNTRPGMPLTVFRHLNKFETARLLEKQNLWSGADIQISIYRVYPLGRVACHLIGSTRNDDSSLAHDRKDFFYYIPDLTGRDGVEKAADTSVGVDAIKGLRGEPGYSLVQVDNLGFRRRTLIEKIEPIHGNNLILTLDSRAQRIAEKLISYSQGAMVVLDADTGDVIAAASNPGYDLGKFSPALPASYYKTLLNDPAHPLLNRAFMGTYTPGSILKPLVALGFLNSGIKPEENTFCSGENEVGNATIRCAAYRRGGHGEVDMTSALCWSCNSYMIENILKTGKTPARDILHLAGIGEPSGIELPEAVGIFPSDDAKQKAFGRKWTSYDTALLSIGQGLITLTPLQAALFTAAIANGGNLLQPHIIKSVVDPFGNTLYTREVKIRQKLSENEDFLAEIRKGMFEVVNSNTGSGRQAAVGGLEIYGKTGSAEVGVRPNIKINAWFIAFTEYKGRKYAVSVIQENARSGGTSCAPLAADFFRRYLLSK